MKIRQIKAFLAVVRTGSVRRAANQLSLTQSTVAKAVSQLEAELGSPLFERSAMGLRLNAAGQSLLPYAETISTNADSATAAVKAAATGRFKTLRVSITPTLPPDILAAAVAHFRSRYPTVKLIFTSGFFDDCLPKLLTDKIDLSLAMVGLHQHEEMASLAMEPLFEVDQGVVAAPTHPIFAPGADIQKIFAESEWLSTVQDEALLRGVLRDLGVETPRALTLCDFYGVDAMNGRSGALSLSPLSVVEDPRYAGRLSALDPTRFPLPPLKISFFHSKAVTLSPPADFMRTAIRSAFESWLRSEPHRYVRAAG